MKNKNHKIGERQTKQAKIYAFFDAMLPEYGHVDDVGGNGNEETQRQQVHVDELLKVLLSFVGNQVFRVVPWRHHRREWNHEASFWSLECLCDVVDLPR